MIVDIVDKYCTDDNNPIKNLRLRYSLIQLQGFMQSTLIWVGDLGTRPKNQNFDVLG